MKTVSRVVVAVLVLVVTVPVVLIVGVGIWLHFAWAAPDIHQQIKSADFQQRHTAAIAGTDEATVTFFTTAPRGTRLADSVRDRCAATSDVFGAKPTTKCDRRVVVYLAFNGDLAAVQRTWSRNLAPTGWAGPEQPAPATIQRFDSATGTALITWHTRPQIDRTVGDFERGVPETDYDHQVTLEQKPIDVADVYQDAYAQNRYLAEIAIDEAYYPGAPLPSPTPTRSWTGCFGGHGHCPGG
jgi:hypothetical protein